MLSVSLDLVTFALTLFGVIVLGHYNEVDILNDLTAKPIQDSTCYMGIGGEVFNSQVRYLEYFLSV